MLSHARPVDEPRRTVRCGTASTRDCRGSVLHGKDIARAEYTRCIAARAARCCDRCRRECDELMTRDRCRDGCTPGANVEARARVVIRVLRCIASRGSGGIRRITVVMTVRVVMDVGLFRSRLRLLENGVVVRAWPYTRRSTGERQVQSSEDGAAEPGAEGSLHGDSAMVTPRARASSAARCARQGGRKLCPLQRSHRHLLCGTQAGSST